MATDLHTAAKLALEALEGLEALLLSMGLTHLIVYGDAEKAITSLSQAIANEALDRMAENARELGLDYELQDKDPDLIEQPAQQQEPVFWAISYDGKTPYALWPDGDGALFDLEIRRQGGTASKMPLYTSPPQRKPLTDEEIESINVKFAGSRDLARLFARAIEAAHGIKGEKK